MTRPVERLAWSLRLDPKPGAAPNPAADWLIGRWLEGRFNFDLRLDAARNSLRAALILVLGLGLPLTAFFVAFNPAWGFTWYFNTESWATGVYQKLTEARVDEWRAAMTGAVRRAYGGESDALFGIHPSGVEGSQDFSFLVIGDPGEGDASQYSLISRYLDLGRRDDVKFLVVSSDVIYPAGAIEDYERNFYLPFQGFAKPVYAIPGNHDWYDALEGFNANFLEPKAARAAIEARVEADYGLTSTNARRMERLVAEAARLRGLYGVDVAHQRAPFFELQTQDFALLAIDTGILRSVDEQQWAWLERALDRSRGKFIMAIVGHPRFAGGHDTPPVAEGGDVSDASGNFAALYRLLASRNVKIAMAGDTHDFEYYKEKVGGEGPARTMHHFVNGGGGAYLSIGTALDFPKQPDCCRLGLLSANRPASLKNGGGDAGVEGAVLALDHMVQRLACQCRGALRRLRFQPRALLSELHGSARRKIEQARRPYSPRGPRPAALAGLAGWWGRPAARCYARRSGRIPGADGSRLDPMFDRLKKLVAHPTASSYRGLRRIGRDGPDEHYHIRGFGCA